MLIQESGGPTTSFHRSVPAGGYPMAAAPPAKLNDIAGATLNGVGASLTARQRDVLAVMMQGKSNKAI
ncbi:LuxR C-terminal-related transcriptional regulator, partial [Escherichia coli]|uniref:LuxR C-terminal-related transcriptional regulator n=1 Tax=Escherichia coli TaxID=562 RepID=UPI002115A046